MPADTRPPTPCQMRALPLANTTPQICGNGVTGRPGMEENLAAAHVYDDEDTLPRPMFLDTCKATARSSSPFWFSSAALVGASLRIEH